MLKRRVAQGAARQGVSAIKSPNVSSSLRMHGNMALVMSNDFIFSRVEFIVKCLDAIKASYDLLMRHTAHDL